MAPTRLLGLGNEILGDDAFGILVAREAGALVSPDEMEVATSSESGLHLLDHILDCRRLIIVDTIQTGRGAPGSIYRLREEDLPAARADCPHGVGLFDALALARKLDLPTPDEVEIIAVEAADCHTIGGAMHPAVRAAIPKVLKLLFTAEILG
ncbi:MAG: hydrogenase maturation protease [Acidobacteriota bacterium]